MASFMGPSVSEQDLAEVCCPLTKRVMSDPVIASDGYSYERKAIEKWIEDGNTTSPRTSRPLTSFELLPNEAMAEVIERSGLSRMSEGDGKRSGLVVPLVALKEVKKAAKRRSDDELSSLSAEALAARQSPRDDAGFSSKAMKNLISIPHTPDAHHNSRAKNSPENLTAHVQKTVAGIEEETNERVLSELTASGRHIVTTYLNHKLPCVIVGGATSAVGSSLSSSGAFAGFEVTSESEICSPVMSPAKVLSMSAPAEFPDYLVSVGQEKGVVRVWKYIENKESGPGSPSRAAGLSFAAPRKEKKKRKRWESARSEATS